MRRLRRDRFGRHNRFLLISLFGLFSVLTVGYAAFQTNISLTAKGNVTPAEEVVIGGQTVTTVRSGDGLYKTSSGVYTYKGAEPDNYLDFHGETWRILKVDSTGIKIIKDE